MTAPDMKSNRIWLVFALVFAWKVALFLFTAQPVPANDAFFYDGAVVNRLLHGGYYNPSLAAAFPISGTQVFSAYPPLYQLPLLAWMSVFGVTARSAMALHLVLFGLYLLVLLAIFRRLQTPAWCVHIAGGFLLVITFHDRPDSLAHLLGMLAVYAWIRSGRIFAGVTRDPHAGIWTWAMVALVVLSLFTGPQIGATYLLWLWIGTLGASLVGQQRLPLLPLLAMLVVPVILVALVRIACPLLWQGFIEHTGQTPSFTGLRLPDAMQLLKALRSAPGVMLAAVFLLWGWFNQQRDFDSAIGLRHEIVLVSALLAALAILGACLSFLTANNLVITDYLQPVIVAAYLTICGALFDRPGQCRLQVVLFLLALALGSVRAVGMTTWGVACARDISYSAAIERVRHELENRPAGSCEVLSCAYLYEAARHTNVHSLHSDWLMPARHSGPNLDLEGLRKWKPAQLILTQFDYYRRYQPVLQELSLDPQLQHEQIENTARTPAPDSFPRLQRVVQNISWAPVIVNLDWR
jgi:hypothetical protein